MVAYNLTIRVWWEAQEREIPAIFFVDGERVGWHPPIFSVNLEEGQHTIEIQADPGGIFTSVVWTDETENILGTEPILTFDLNRDTALTANVAVTGTPPPPIIWILLGLTACFVVGIWLFTRKR